jgi:cytochrome P450
MTPDYDPCLPDWRDDPYPHYRELRDCAPVHFAPSTQAYCVSRYDDVMYVLRNPELFSSRAMFTVLMNNGREGAPPLTWPVVRFLVRFWWHTRMDPRRFMTARNLIAEDGESHSAMRSIVNRGFTPRRIAAWEGRVREIVDACLAKLRNGEGFDLIEDLAIPLPVTIIAEMLGIAPDKRRDFKRWSDAIIDVATGPGRADPFSEKAQRTIIELTRYFQGVAEERRSQPTQDLVSAIVAEQDGGAALTVREVIQFVMILLVAGNETTTNLIGNAVNALLDHPDQLDPVPDRDRRHRDRGHDDPEGRLRGAASRLGEPRRAALPGTGPLRRRARHPRPPGLRLRQALLSRRLAGAPRGARRARGARPGAAPPGAHPTRRPRRLVPGPRPASARAAPRRVANPGVPLIAPDGAPCAGRVGSSCAA